MGMISTCLTNNMKSDVASEKGIGWKHLGRSHNHIPSVLTLMPHVDSKITWLIIVLISLSVT